MDSDTSKEIGKSGIVKGDKSISFAFHTCLHHN